MANLTRRDKKEAAARKLQKERKARSIKELEIVFAIGGLYIIDYYNRRPVRRFLTRIGVRNKKVKEHFMDRAARELSDPDVDYRWQAWSEKYDSKGFLRNHK